MSSFHGFVYDLAIFQVIRRAKGPRVSVWPVCSIHSIINGSERLSTFVAGVNSLRKLGSKTAASGGRFHRLPQGHCILINQVTKPENQRGGIEA